MARIDIKSAGGGGSGSGTVTSVAVSSTTLTVTGSPITTSGTIVANIPDGYLKVGTGVTSSLQNVVDTNGTATTLFLSSTAAQFTSPLRITTSDASGFYLDAEDSATNNRFSIKRDPSAQEVTLDFASNPAGSTTLVGAIRTYRDGVNLSNAMSFIEDGSVGIGTNAPSQQLHVNGSLRIETGGIYDGTNSIGTSGQVLSSTGTATAWITPATTSPAGTTGAVQFNNAGAFGADSSNFFWDDTNKRLGVGINAPIFPFQVKTTQANANGSIGFTNTSAATIIAFTDTGSAVTQLQFRASSYNFTDCVGMRISQGGYGNVATAMLQVIGSGSTAATDALIVQNSSATTLFSVRDDGVATFSSAITGGSFTGNIRTDFINTSNNAYTVLQTNPANGNGKFYESVSIGTSTDPVASARLELVSTTKGFLPPRMTTAEKNAIATPAAGLMVYDTTLNKLCVYTTAWETITSV